MRSRENKLGWVPGFSGGALVQADKSAGKREHRPLDKVETPLKFFETKCKNMQVEILETLRE